jgi:FtsZ-binding cell division protein ZapB
MSLANDYDTNDIDDTQGHNDYSITMLQMLVDELRERNYKQCYEKTED